MINERRPEDDIICEQFGCEDKTHPVYHDRESPETALHSVICGRFQRGIAAHSFIYDPLGILSDCRYLAAIVKTSTPFVQLKFDLSVATDTIGNQFDEIARLQKIVKRASGMGLCSQTHHEHLMLAARDVLNGEKP